MLDYIWASLHPLAMNSIVPICPLSCSVTWEYQNIWTNEAPLQDFIFKSEDKPMPKHSHINRQCDYHNLKQVLLCHEGKFSAFVRLGQIACIIEHTLMSHNLLIKFNVEPNMKLNRTIINLDQFQGLITIIQFKRNQSKTNFLKSVQN